MCLRERERERERAVELNRVIDAKQKPPTVRNDVHCRSSNEKKKNR